MIFSVQWWKKNGGIFGMISDTGMWEGKSRVMICQGDRGPIVQREIRGTII